MALNTTVNVAHGLGREPDWISAYLECLTAEHGYAVGDRISAYNYNRSISGADDTNVWVSTQQTTLPYIVNKNGGNDLEITGANWSFFAVPYITDGSGMGGGGGDITGVGVGVGLSGGGDTGDVTINLDLNGLPTLPAITTTDRVIVIDGSDGNAAKDQSIGDFGNAITTFLRLDALSLESLIVATDNFMFSDTSNSNATRRVTWGGAIARMADQATLITANAVMRINDGGVGTNELADASVTEPKIFAINTPAAGQVLAFAAGDQFAWSDAGTGDITSVAATSGLSGGGTTGAVSLGIADEGVTEPRLDISNGPVDDYVIAWDGPNSTMVWRAEGSPTPPLTHTRYFALGADRTFVEADYTSGLSFATNTFTVPAFTSNSYYGIAVPITNPITAIIAATSPEQNITSQFTNEANLSIAGEDHQIWISNVAFFPAGSGTPIRLA